MREIFDKYIDWDNLSNDKQDEFSLEVTDAVLSKSTGVLTVELALNFVIPIHNEQKIRAIILSGVSGVSDVELKCHYNRDEKGECQMAQTRDEILIFYLPKMIQRANGTFRALTENTMEDGMELNGDTMVIRAVGNLVTDKLNKSVASIFENYIRDDFGWDYKVLFVNDQDNYEKTLEAMESSAIEAAKEQYEKSQEAVKKAKESKKTKKETEGATIKTPEEKKKTRNDFFARRKAKDAPVTGNIIMGGKPIQGKSVPIKMVEPTMESAVTEGIVFHKEMTVFSSGSMMAKLYITDKAESMSLKTFVSEGKWKDIDDHINIGDYIKVKGQPKLDAYEDNQLVLWLTNIEKGEIPGREDNYEGPHRVELHCHTKMSQMDGLNDVDRMISIAAGWQQPAIAITDHGVVQSFPDAASTASKLAKKGMPIKIIYGMEGYVFDDTDYRAEDGTIEYRKPSTNHIILLAATQEGIKNIYKLVSYSHLNYFYKKPRLPKSLIEAHRQGLIIGSACEAGEVYRAVARGADDEELDRIASFYDYLEIQPLINNQFMLEKGLVETREDLRNLNRRVVECGERLGKLVCATTDAHYDEPESNVYRNIMLGSMGFDNAENGQGLYLRTTEEMLEEFSYLGAEKAYEIVVENTNHIADLVDDNIRPIPEGKFPPVIENSDNILRDSCIARAKEIYGDPLPDVINERLSKELNSIIENKYSVMYVSAQMLVDNSMKAGYMVGSRGSVGSSFVATMAGITEVNPLDPHYVCPKCKYIEWGDRNLYECGLDMPPKECPHCGTPLKRDGFTIPFATFLGFEGDKEPDIDLNFAGEYQATAHKYVGEIFGEKNVFKAGTVSTLKEKNAARLVSKFTEKTGIGFGKIETKRLSLGCQGVKNTTGQHPGGIIIVPDDHEVYEFCPVQHPANKDVDIVTTHFDYHKLENNLMKLDILGHTGPSMLRHLYDMTGVDPLTVDITDRDVLSIFNSTDALNIKDPEYRYTDGTFAIPEFGTHFVRNMLQEIKPQKIADLVRIAGFSHGTDVWTNNAQDYINEGVATMSEVISTRDDIMNYLILKGVENKMSFDIMEDVRKNRPLKEEQLTVMKEHGVPDWYIESCKKIQYMFPRAHAAAYVMTSMRMAWYKVHWPREFYAAHFTTSVDAFETMTIIKGQGACEDAIRRIESRGEYDADYERREKDEKTKPVYEIAYEMYARGYRFKLPELGKSSALRFKVDEGDILLPYVALEGVGEQAAKALEEAYNNKPFMTIEDAINRAKINKTAVESLKSYNVFKGLPETDQISFF